MESIFRIWSDSFLDGQRIPEGFAYAKCDPTGVQRTVPAGNRNPQFAWSNPPAGTNSLVLICQDFDVPADFSNANQEGRTIPADAPRTVFNHWTLVDILPESGAIDAGSLSEGLIPKKGPACANGMRQGLNDYTNPETKYYGYDGPCPPWNDERVHHYIFTLYAIDFPLLPIEGDFYAEDVLRVIEGHILGQCSISGSYSLNPNVK